MSIRGYKISVKSLLQVDLKLRIQIEIEIFENRIFLFFSNLKAT